MGLCGWFGTCKLEKNDMKLLTCAHRLVGSTGRIYSFGRSAAPISDSGLSACLIEASSGFSTRFRKLYAHALRYVLRNRCMCSPAGCMFTSPWVFRTGFLCEGRTWEEMSVFWRQVYKSYGVIWRFGTLSYGFEADRCFICSVEGCERGRSAFSSGSDF